MAGFVYLIGSSTFRWYKIGKSKTPEVRVTDLGVLLPFKITVHAVWKATNHHSMEKLLHSQYQKNQINGEWFEFTKDEVRSLIESIPSEANVFLSEEHKLQKFSNVAEDTINGRRVLGPRLQKLRGEFTPEERDAIRIERMEQAQEFKRLGLTRTGKRKIDLTCRSCQKKNIDPSNFCSNCGKSLQIPENNEVKT